ncbi:MAG: tRNA (adenosine(37)-N6)-threonylcarbamoyltransferase complex ATPase subunit type 1 TsaE [Firmicutes bacterium]|nr:tRNA (adenosine(37)-N6)-threonylcarbamoyltransferase complex ATPase subunit type 1 TsaE [Bacillota bacterium]MCL2256517.1 tRNA (adenosine(37)-N6)-threonylcarbamoyltransferase complex ATPase subunit type 1 TsaE [Bacillota bacterium]
MKFISKKENETLRFAFEFATKLKGGDVICLHGDLGAGKTTFTKGLAKGLGVDSGVTSPTFSILNEYDGKRWKLYHIDAYRLKDAEEAVATGLCDYIFSLDAVVVIEWFENISQILPKEMKKVSLKFVKENVREIEIQE